MEPTYTMLGSDGNQYGPATLEQFREWIREGRAGADTQVWRSDQPAWAKAAALPENSPFTNWHEARLFAGPLPFTFDYEPETHSLVLIEGVRQHWHPQPVAVEVARCSFFERPPFRGVRPILANAFHVANIDYRWKRGVVEPLTAYPKPVRLATAFA